MTDRVRQQTEKERPPGPEDFEAIPDPFGGDRSGGPRTSSSSSSSSTSKPGEIEAVIRQTAAKYNIDPDVAVRVAQSEGGLNDPFRQGEAMLKYGREESYGPFQLHIRNGGVGERAIKAGIDPRKDWKGGIDYALREASQNGWGQWFGAAKAKIGDWEGIGGPRRKPTSVTKGDYDLPVATSPTSATDTGFDTSGAPSSSDEEFPAPAADSGSSEEEGGGTRLTSDQASFQLAEVDLPEISDWTEFARLAAVQQPQFLAPQDLPPPGASQIDLAALAQELRKNPSLFARKGGMIPQGQPRRFQAGGPVQRFQTGGQPLDPEMAPRPAVDPYNSTRSYTQQIPESGARPTFVPRRISQPVLPDRTAAGARTTSQQAWDAAKAKAAADKAAAAAAAAQPAAAAAAPVGYTDAEMRRFRQMQMLGIPLKSGTWADVAAKATPQQYTDLKLMGYGSGSIGKNGLFGQGGKQRGGHLEKGGMVPTSFARGGAVSGPDDDDGYWQTPSAEFDRIMRQESRRGGSAQDARDRAAKRVNQRERGITSSAYRPPSDRPSSDRNGRRGHTAPSRTDGGTTSPASAAPERRILEDRETRERRLPDISRNPFDTQRGVERTPPGRLSDEYVLPPMESTGRTSMPVPTPDIVQSPEHAERVRRDVEINQEKARRLRESLQPDPQRFAPDEVAPEVPAAPEAAAPDQMGFWLRGQWVPYDPSMVRYQHGGSVLDMDEADRQRRPLSPRVAEANYTTSAPGAPSPSSAQTGSSSGRPVSPVIRRSYGCTGRHPDTRRSERRSDGNRLRSGNRARQAETASGNAEVAQRCRPGDRRRHQVPDPHVRSGR